MSGRLKGVEYALMAREENVDVVVKECIGVTWVSVLTSRAKLISLSPLVIP